MQPGCKVVRIVQLGAISTNAFIDHTCTGSFETGWNMGLWDFCLSKAIGFTTLYAVKVDVLILWFAFTAFFTQSVFQSACSIVNTMDKLLVFKCFEGSVKRSFICPFKFCFQVTETYCCS